MTTEDLDEQEYISWKDIPGMVEGIERITFGSMLKTWRQCEEWTQAELAAKLGISKSFVSDYERGRALPSLEQAWRIGEVFGAEIQFALQAVNDQAKRANLPIKLTLAS